MNIETDRLFIRKVLNADAMLDAMKCPEIHSMHINQFIPIEIIQDYIRLLTTKYDSGKYRTAAMADENTNQCPNISFSPNAGEHGSPLFFIIIQRLSSKLLYMGIR